MAGKLTEYVNRYRFANSVRILNHSINIGEPYFQIGHVGVEWNKIDDTYLRLQAHTPPLAAAVAWDKAADTYSRPERG